MRASETKGPTRYLTLAALTVAAVAGLSACSSATGPGEFEPVVVPQIASGATQATSDSYWVGNFSTSGAYLLLQIFEDGTGRLSYHNDAFQPPTGLTTRNLYDFTWAESATGITMSYSGVTASFTAFTAITSETSFEVVFSDGTNVNEDFEFLWLPLPGGVGTDPPL